MYIVNLTYLKPLSDVELHREGHKVFLDANYKRGFFLASGPKIPRDGGVILVRGTIERDALEKLITEDPFYQHEIADYQITEFNPVNHQPTLEGLL